MYTNTRQTLIEHYAAMALEKGWIDQARFRVKELESCPSGMWLGIGKQIKEKIDEKKKQLQTTVHP
jgi:hypothetical protein